VRYSGHLVRGITAANAMPQHPRVTGYDLFLAAARFVPLDAAGMGTDAPGFGARPRRGPMQ
jgi:hypothetical protein